MAVNAGELRQHIRALRRIVDALENQLEPSAREEADPYRRRREVLQVIYWSDNSVPKEELLKLLAEHGTNYAWIGQQVKIGYLTLRQVPGGGTRYSVTSKGIREQRLDEEEKQETAAWSRASEAALAEDWDQEEDTLYDDV